MLCIHMWSWLGIDDSWGLCRTPVPDVLTWGHVLKTKCGGRGTMSLVAAAVSPGWPRHAYVLLTSRCHHQSFVRVSHTLLHAGGHVSPVGGGNVIGTFLGRNWFVETKTPSSLVSLAQHLAARDSVTRNAISEVRSRLAPAGPGGRALVWAPRVTCVRDCPRQRDL